MVALVYTRNHHCSGRRSSYQGKIAVVCPNFGHPVQKSVIYRQIKIIFFALESICANIVNKLLVLKLFQISNGDYSMPTAATYSVFSAHY